MFTKLHISKNSFCLLKKIAVKYRAAIFLLISFCAVNIHILTQNATTMPPHSVAFGTNDIVEPALKSISPIDAYRPLSGYYTADPTGTSALYPYDHYTLNSLTQGDIPFWNPYTLTGLPFLAEYQWGIFYPLNWLRLIIPEAWWDLYSAFHILLLALIVYSIARSAYGSYMNAIFAGMAVFGIGFLLLYFPTHTLIVEVPWGALLILGIECLAKRERDFVGLIFIAIGVYCLGTAGHPTPAIFWSVAVFVFLFMRLVLDRETVKVLIPFFAASIFAALLASPNLVPFVTYVLNDEGNAVSKFDHPMFFTLRDLFMFLFPYVFGPLNSIHPIELLTKGVTSGFLIPTSFVTLSAFIGGWVAIKRKNIPLLALMISAFIITLWAFGIPPASWLSKLPLLSRLSFHYSWIVPSTVICVLAGYGFGFFLDGQSIQVKKLIYSYVAFYLASAFLLLGYLWHFEALHEFLGAGRILIQGILPSLGFAILGPLLILYILCWIDRNGKQHLRKRLLSSILILGLGFSIAAVYPTAGVPGSVVMPFIFLSLFVGITTAYIILAKVGNSIFEYITKPIVTIIMTAALITVANLIFPGLPERYNIISVPRFVSEIGANQLNWRVYGLDGAVPLNNLIRYNISAFNNQNALVPTQLRNFIYYYLDSKQGPTHFFGFSYAPGIDPSSEYLRNIRFWEYVGVRYIVVAFAGYPTEKSNLMEQLGFESAGSDRSEIVVLPQVTGKKNPSDLIQKFNCSEGKFSIVRMRLGTYGRINPGRIVLVVTNTSGNILAQASLDSRKITDAYYHYFSFGREMCVDPSQTVNISIKHEDATPGWVVASWRSGNRTVDILRIFSEPRSPDNQFRLYYTDAETGVAVFEDPNALPRAYFTNRFIVASDWRSAQQAFAKQQDLRAIAYGEVGDTPCKSTPEDLDSQPSPTASVVSITNIWSSSISMQAVVPSAGTLVLVDTFMPGWTAKVNGKPASVLRINGVFRGVCLDDAGTYNVVMTYRPPYWNLAILLAAMGLVGLLLLFVFTCIKSHTKNKQKVRSI